MDIHIVIKDDVIRGIVTSMLLAVVGGFFIIIVQSAREGVTFWLYKHFPNNRGKLYVMATSRGGSYLDVLGLFNLLGGFPIFVVLLLMSVGILANMFSGLVVGTKNIKMDLCIKDQCFSTGFGENLLEGYANATTIAPTKTTDFVSMNKFVLQPTMNDTITSGLPWAWSNPRRLTAVKFPSEIRQVPLDRLSKRVEYTGIYDSVQIQGLGVQVDYANGTSLFLAPGETMAPPNNWTLDNEWNIFDAPTLNGTDPLSAMKIFYLSTNGTAGINLLLATSFEEGFGNGQSQSEALNHILNNNASEVARTTYYGAFTLRSWLGIVDLTFKARSDGNDYQLELSTIANLKQVRFADTDKLYNATLSNLNDNMMVLRNHSRELQAVYRGTGSGTSSVFNSGDFLSYVATCFTMAVNQTRPMGMIKGYDQADVVTPVISIKSVLAIPLLLATIALFIPYAIVTIKLYTNNDQWLRYKLHVDAREYIINLCHSRFLVSKPIGDIEVLKVIREDHSDDGPVFELEKLVS
ncbi:hypothetical protein BGZ83_008253 [Gryganskiella cystojenkinii]|nr:hypothetical protein BGZ83_008253 [Gryganskiella cystojenkinii]